MYDIFSIHPHNFGFAETSDFVHFKNLGHFNEGVMKTTNYTSPKHGAVIHLTKRRLTIWRNTGKRISGSMIVKHSFASKVSTPENEKYLMVKCKVTM